MHFIKVTPNQIATCLRSNNNERDYCFYQDDTNETIDLLLKLKCIPKLSNEQIREWFLNNLKMRESEISESIYRAFLCLKNDDIFNLRISRHYSTEKTTKTAWDKIGEPNLELHIIVERIYIRKVNSDTFFIDKDCIVECVPVLVSDYSLSDFNNPNKRSDIIDEIIYFLVNGSDKNKRIDDIEEMLNITPMKLSKTLQINTKKYNINKMRKTSTLNESKKKQLYESIMQNVAKVVKKHLNEGHGAPFKYRGDDYDYERTYDLKQQERNNKIWFKRAQKCADKINDLFADEDLTAEAWNVASYQDFEDPSFDDLDWYGVGVDITFGPNINQHLKNYMLYQNKWFTRWIDKSGYETNDKKETVQIVSERDLEPFCTIESFNSVMDEVDNWYRKYCKW